MRFSITHKSSTEDFRDIKVEYDPATEDTGEALRRLDALVSDVAGRCPGCFVTFGMKHKPDCPIGPAS